MKLLAVLLCLVLGGCDSVEKAMDPNGTNDPAGYDNGRVSVEERNQQTLTPEQRNDLVTVPPP